MVFVSKRWWRQVCVLVVLCLLCAGCTEMTPRDTYTPQRTTPMQGATVQSQSGGKVAVLFDAAHAERVGNADWVISHSIPDPLGENRQPRRESDWTGGISAWGVELYRTGSYTLKTNNRPFSYGDTNNPLDLSKFKVLVIPEPNTVFAKAEKDALVTFVQRGGGLFMIADHTGSDRNRDGYDSPQIFNDLMNANRVQKNPFGFQFDNIDVNYENPNNINASKSQSDPLVNGPFGRVRASTMRSGTTLTLTGPDAQGVIYRARYTNTGKTGVFVVRSEYGKGRIVALGDSSVIDDGTCAGADKCYDGWTDPQGQNRALVLNATQWLGALR